MYKLRLISPKARWLWLFLLPLLASEARAQAEAGAPCGERLAEAEAHYVGGQPDRVEPLLEGCLDGRLGEDAVAAYRLLALARLKEGEETAAMAAIIELLDAAPSYEPDPVRDLPAYVALVDAVRQQLGLAVTRDQCSVAFEAAAASYQAEAYNAAVRHLSECLNRETESDAERAVQVYRLLALAHLGKGDVGSARATVVRLLNVAPDYEPDPDADPRSYQALVRIVRSRRGRRAPGAAGSDEGALRRPSP